MPFAMLLSTIGKPLMSRKDLPSWFHDVFSSSEKKKLLNIENKIH